MALEGLSFILGMSLLLTVLMLPYGEIINCIQSFLFFLPAGMSILVGLRV